MTHNRKTETYQRRMPRQARSRATVEAILDAAARILRESGPEGLTTNRISETAGVGVASLYGYFPDKTAVLVALARRLMAQDEAAILLALQTAPEGEGVRAVVGALLSRHRGDVAVRRAVMSVHHGQGLAGEQTRPAQRTISAVIAGQDLPPAGDGDARLFVLTRAVLGVARACVEEVPSMPEQVLEDEIVRLIELSLGGPVGAVATRSS